MSNDGSLNCNKMKIQGNEQGVKHIGEPFPVRYHYDPYGRLMEHLLVE